MHTQRTLSKATDDPARSNSLTGTAASDDDEQLDPGLAEMCLS